MCIYLLPSGSAIKNLPEMQESRVQPLGQEDPLEEGMATHSSNLAWRIPWTRSLVGYSPWSRKELDATEQLSMHIAYAALAIQEQGWVVAMETFWPPPKPVALCRNYLSNAHAREKM